MAVSKDMPLFFRRVLIRWICLVHAFIHAFLRYADGCPSEFRRINPTFTSSPYPTNRSSPACITWQILITAWASCSFPARLSRSAMRISSTTDHLRSEAKPWRSRRRSWLGLVRGMTTPAAHSIRRAPGPGCGCRPHGSPQGHGVCCQKSS